MTDSVSTASTPDDIKTPDSTGLTGFHFHLDENPVAGPTGPHLFRPTGDGSKQKSSSDIEIILNDTPISTTTPRYRRASKPDSQWTDNPVPEKAPKQKKRPLTTRTAAESIEAAAASWTPQEVVTWMQKIGMDEEIVEKFFINDISGSVLLDLQPEDLKELEIHSFGKRHRLMTSIRQLRNSIMLPPNSSQTEVPPVEADPAARGESSTPESAIAVVGTGCSGSPITEDEQPPVQARQRGQGRRRRCPQAVNPDGSVSIVAIEQLLPKLHTCSKGEECRKWRKQQAKLARIARDFPVESLGCGNSMALRGDPGNAATAQNLVKSPKSEVAPSIIASSDALGPNQAAQQYPLSEDKLNVVEPRDPQENVRHFINFQRLSRLQPVNDPATPPRETFPSPNGDSPNSMRNASLSENLRHLPKLRIPSTHLSVSESSANLSAQRTITPSILRKKTPFADQNTYGREEPSNQYGSVFSPSEFYRQHPHYDQSTPLSEVDVPMTAIPLGPVERNFSQSVPPDMRFGSDAPIARPPSTKAENHRRNTSYQNGPNFRVLRPLDEGRALPPIETPEDLENTPRAAHCRSNPFGPTDQYANDVTHSGWMKKRKTTRFLRREWEEHHFALRGTQLAMFPDEDASRRNAKALEQIDVDDYAVACSSLPSNSKLTAAFKKTVLKRNDNQAANAAFAFSLIPSLNGNAERKASLLNGPKSHHFAVKSRDERIDWMRELMLAKALKKGRDSGATLNVNGSMI